ncbi:isoprenylcysteine carboxylmethyltransferase family protein [Occultella glacieicola]|uniref:Isoprenylcysteine carboxylmethyltransferase family protein n=1 Tax=Occultella glacieicola TaxID=2518684 RepID=A0ABY2E5C3_9MICO|nr:methyltransferase [Occultella glacieicola]TDE95774.1 isoprenylcysteine carboxylmethyltransferase family protein [Occultella glacieicola]
MRADDVAIRPATVARSYLAAQAVAGVLWWVAVLGSDTVRVWTLGSWDPWLLVGPDLLLFVGGSALGAARGSWRVAAVTAAWSALLTIALLGQGLLEGAAGWGVLLMLAATSGSVTAAGALRFGRIPTSWYFVGPFRFREARARSRWRHVAASLTQLVVFWVGFFVVVPLLLVAFERRLRVDWSALAAQPWPTVGAVLFLAASPLGFASCLTMAIAGEGTPLPAQTARQLVVAGPYRWLRNPMATAGVLQSIGAGLWFGSWTMMVAAMLGALAWHFGIRGAEEADLAARFGDPYERYRASVPVWVPRPPVPTVPSGPRAPVR